MKRKKSTAAVPIEHVSDLPDDACDLPNVYCHCEELAPAIAELTRQIHLLGVIIDELVSEFQWQNNQLSENIRTATDFYEESKEKSSNVPCQTVSIRRETLFE